MVIFFLASVPSGSSSTAWDGLERKDHSSSVSSVEEATEEILSTTDDPSQECQQRKITNQSYTESTTKSPRFLPKFIRSSFSKLISKEKSKSSTPTGDPMSLPFFSTFSIPKVSSPTLSYMEYNDALPEDTLNEAPDANDSNTFSPNTRQFVQDSLAKGLPLIPFNYSSADIVEKRRSQTRSKTFFPVSSPPPYNYLEEYHSPALSTSPARTKYRKVEAGDKQ